MGAGNTPVGDKFTGDVNANAHSLTNVASVLGTSGSPLSDANGAAAAAAAASIPLTNLDTDPTLAANSNAHVPSQAAVVTYVAAHAGGGGSPYVVYNGNNDTFNASAGNIILVDGYYNYAGGTIELPASPADGTTVEVRDMGACGGSSSGFSSCPVTVDGNGAYIISDGYIENPSLSLSADGTVAYFVYSADFSQWLSLIK
jgi:hypothetical protein